MKDFASRLCQVVPSASMSMAQKIQDMPDILDFTWGQPDFDTPDHIKESALKAIKDGKNGYTLSSGIPELKKAIAEFYKNYYGVFYDPLQQVLVVPGAKQGLMYLMQALLNPGDEVILMEPCWLSYRDMVVLNGGVPRFIPAGNGLRPDVASLIENVTHRTKVILLNNPVNPSGYVFSRQELEEIVRVAVKYDLFIISDEIYDRVVFTDFTSLSQISLARERLALVNGFSKAYAMTGWRIGYILASAEIMSRVSLIHQHTATCAASVSQYAALSAITDDQSCVNIMCRIYRERRDFLISLLAHSKFKAIIPEGTFYLMLDCAGVDRNTATPAEFLFNQFGIASVDGIFYGASSAEYARLSLTCSENVLRKAAARLCGYEEKASL